MFNFIWDNKPDKISRDKITQDYCHGGLKMLEIEIFIHSLKCSNGSNFNQIQNGFKCTKIC